MSTSVPVFKALTRPPMKMGVTMGYLIFEIILVEILFIGCGSLLYTLVVIPMHVTGYLVCLKDPHYFDLIHMKAIVLPTTLNRSFWGGNSYLQ